MANNSNTPTLRQRLFAKKYIEYKGNGAKAALQVYDVKKDNAPNLAHQLIEKPVVQKEITKLLNQNGLDLQTLTGWTNDAVTNNLQNGKASQAVGADLLKFLFKLHNAVPVNKSMSVKYTRSEQLPSKDILEIKVLLTEMNKKTSKLLEDLEK